jgi:hypothetical protein
MAEAAGEAEADRLLVFQLKSEDGAANGPRVVMTGWAFDMATGKRVAGGQRFCEKCTKLDTLVGLAGELGAELLAAGAAKSPSTFIEVHSTPTGATVVIDGKAVGPTGEAYAVEPGRHTVEVRLAGHGTVTREHEPKAGETVTDRVTLLAIGTDSGDGLSPLYKWGALGGGVVLTTLGIAWVAADGPQTEDGPGGIQLRQPEERKTLVPGILSTTVGVGLLGLSGYLFYRDMSTERATRAAVAPTRGGAIFGLSGSF